ncbi:GTP binding protein [Lactobacillus delbrueckii subsp. bulgaricus 2038]|nr:GTP binding protein [Lactobacillus delbrueckii subsp. bulgaricus 2038]
MYEFKAEVANVNVVSIDSALRPQFIIDTHLLQAAGQAHDSVPGGPGWSWVPRVQAAHL